MREPGFGAAFGAGNWRRACASLLAFVALCLLPMRALAGGLAFEVVQVEAREALVRGEANYIAVQLKNLSDQPWDPADKVRVAYHLREPGVQQPLVFDGTRSELPRVVAPGEVVWVHARVDVPEHGGPLELEWAMLQESVRWFPRPSKGLDPVHSYALQDRAPSWSSLSLSAPAQWMAGALRRVTVRVRNEGPVTWDPARGDRLALRWTYLDGAALQLDGTRIELPGRVGPGESVQVSASAIAPEPPSRVATAVRVRVEPVREGVRWYGPSAASTEGLEHGPLELPSVNESSANELSANEPLEVEAPEELIVELLPHALQWSVEGVPLAHTMPAAGRTRVRVQVKNAGTATWGQGDALSYRWIDDQGAVSQEGPRTHLPRALAPDESIAVEAHVHAPATPGQRRLRWEMVRETQRWFGQPLVGDPEMRVDVGAPRLAWALLASGEPGWAWASGETTVKIRVENRGLIAWSEAAGDRISYHWYNESGEVVQFEGVRTHFDTPVQPGESVELDATLVMPREPGRYALEWDMVREHERWYGGATGQRVSARVFRKRVSLQLLLSLLTLMGAIALRRRPPRSPLGRALVQFAPVPWTLVVVASIAVVFNELAHLPFWEEARNALWSGAAWLALPVAALTGRARWICAATVVMAASFLAFIDLVYMHFFGSILPLNAVGHAGHVWEVVDSAITRIDAEQVWLFAPALAGVVAVVLTRRPSARSPEVDVEVDAEVEAVKSDDKKGLRRERWIALVVCVVAGIPATLHLRATLKGTIGDRVFSEQDNVGRMGVFNAHAFELLRTLREAWTRKSLNPGEREALADYFALRAREAANAVDTPAGRVWNGAASGANLLLIQVEALQQWVIDLEVQGQPVTPFLNRWHAQQGVSYTRVVDQTAQGKTSDAEFLALNSQHPLGRGATAFLRADNDFSTLAHALKAVGYETFSAHPYRRGFWNRAVLHPRYGFDESWFRRELGDGAQTGWGLADGPLLERVTERLATMGTPWFAFVITLSLHHPYTEFPASLASLDVGELQGQPLGNYLQAMNYFDAQLAATFERLETLGLASNTVVAVFGDHDARFELHRTPALLELLGESQWSPSLPAMLERVPLLVRVPHGADRGVLGELDVLGGHIDIAPTLLHLLGVPRPASFLGRALVPAPASDAAPDAGADLVFAAYPNGSAYASDRVFVPRGREIPAGGACFHFPSGKARELQDCDRIRARASDELRNSRGSLDANLAGWLSATEDR